MPITPFHDEESAFDPEIIQLMGEALTDACRALGLKQKDDAANRLLAARIIDLAQAGVRDAALLTAGALEGLGRAG